MPTEEVQLTDAVAVDIKTALGLVDGLSYMIQARGGNVLLTEQATAPTIGTTPTHLLPNDGAPWTYVVRSDQRLYAWAQFTPCDLIITSEA